jgi:hypothetical protein
MENTYFSVGFTEVEEMYRRLSVLQQLSSEKRCRKRPFINVLQYFILTSFFILTFYLETENGYGCIFLSHT